MQESYSLDRHYSDIGVCVVMFLVLRSYLSWQNEKRERESHDDSYDNVYLTYVDEKGNSTERRVDKVGCSGFWFIYLGLTW